MNYQYRDNQRLSSILHLRIILQNSNRHAQQVLLKLIVKSNFGLAGTGLSVGRDGGSPVTSAYEAPFAFTGGTIERVIVDVSGDNFVDHELEVRAWLARD